MPGTHTHLKLKFCVSGAAETAMCSVGALENAKTLGAEVARMGAVLVNGATTGFPYWAAIGAKEAGGFTIGISPAASEREHVERYHLPVDYMDMIVYTGMGYSARNLLLTRTADAVIIGCGRIGTLNEFTVAFEDAKPIGILKDDGGTTNLLGEIIKASHRGAEHKNIIFESDPKTLLEKLTALVRQEKFAEV